MKVFKVTLTLFLCLLLLPDCKQGEKETRVLKLAHGLSPTHSVHQGLVFMNKRLEELSGGKMSLDIYPSSQLGSESQCIELLQVGSLDITKVSSASLEGFVDLFKVFGLPYVMESREQYFKVLDGPIGDELLTVTEPYWFRGLAYFDAGARSFYTTGRAIHKPEDLKGLKIRVQQSPIAMEMMAAFGGSAAPVDWGELYTALQSNVVDGAENNTPSITTAFHHEVAKYFIVNEHTMCPDVIIISSATWEKLNEQEHTWLQQAATDATIHQRKLWEEQEKESLQEIKDKGIEIIYPDKKPFIEAAQPMIEKYKQNPVYRDLIEKIQNTL